MKYETIQLETDTRGVATLTLMRPDKHNAMNAQMIDELQHAADNLGADTSVRAVILAATGKSFCAGGDLLWMQDQAKQDRAGKIRNSEALAHMLASFNSLPKMLIGRVHGAAYGGGLGLIAVCDVAIAVTGTKFGLTETRLGLIPATIGPFIVSKMGSGFSRQVFFGGSFFSTDLALRSSLISHECAPEQLDTLIEDQIQSVLKCAPGAEATAKELCLLLGGVSSADMSTMTANALADRWENAEAQAGIAAFFDRTPPPWVD
ncbi:MAG: enoyl-CoA hydratase/isomerase family protein [Rhizobiales bacterium]|nr:enoyl-CoA hydratase/isomerase family protein [Hyphomicrobiales bacterium]